MKISVVGLGYVGLPVTICLAELGWTMHGIDINSNKINMLNKGKLTQYELELQELFVKNRDKITFTSSMDPISVSDIVIITVGTPSKKNKADLSYLYSAFKEITGYLRGYTCIIIKSTVPPGTNEKFESLIKEKSGADFDLVFLPEFLREGSAVYDFFNPDRIIIGSDSKKAIDMIKELYKPMGNDKKFMVTSKLSAEIIKHASNAFLAMKIEFINEISDLCGEIGGDISEVSHGIGLDKRIGDKFLNPGPGFGGSCFPKDIEAIINVARDYNVKLPLIENTIQMNNNRQNIISERILNTLKQFKDPKIAIFGLTFKGETDDCRNSPSIKIINNLLKNDLNIIVYDPKGMDNSKQFIQGNIKYANDEYDLVKDVDCLVILTDWNQIKKIDLVKVKILMKNNIIIDLRNMINSKEAVNLGFKLVQIGKKQISSDNRLYIVNEKEDVQL